MNNPRCGTPPFGGDGGGTILAPAILLVVEVVFAKQLVATLVESALAPVLCPEASAGNGSLGGLSGTCDLFDALPARRGEGGGEPRESQLLRFACCCGQTQGEAKFAATSAFGFVLQSAYVVFPLLVVVVAVDPSHPEAISMPLALLLADLIFLKRVDVGIVIEDDGAQTMSQQPLDNGR